MHAGWNLFACGRTLLALLLGLMSLQAEPVPLEMGPHKDLRVEPVAEGEFEITLGSGDPHFWTGVVSETFDADRHQVFEFEFFAPSGMQAAMLRFRIADGSMVVAGSKSLPLSEAWQPWSLDLDEAGVRPAAGHPEMRFHVALQGDPGSVLRLRGLRVRERTAAEVGLRAGKERRRAEREADAEAILADLRRSWQAQIETVQVGKEQIRLSGHAPTAGRLIGLPPEQASHSAKKEGGFEIEPDANGCFTIAVTRVDEESGRDRALWRWRLADPEGRWVSAARWPTGTEPDLGGSLPRLRAAHVKGLGGVPQIGPDHEIFELGIAHATFNVVLTGLLRETPAPGHAPWCSEGRTYYFHEVQAQNRDRTLRHLAERGVIVSAILLVGNQRDDEGQALSVMTHPEAEARGIYAMPNLSTEAGARLYAATLRFLAERHSGADPERVRISNWILHNEIDQAGTWTNMGDQPLARYLECYQRSARLAYHTARLFDRQARVFISLTHHWTKRSAGSGTYVVRDLVEGFAEMARAEGDFEWGVAYHPYPHDLRNPDTWRDAELTTDFDTPYITPKNLEVLPAFLKQERFLFEGRPRGILLSEQGFNTPTLSLADQQRQAAGLVYVFRKLRTLPEIEAYHLHRYQDMPAGEGGLRLGLITETGERKLGWEVYREIGTGSEQERSFERLADEVMAR